MLERIRSILLIFLLLLHTSCVHPGAATPVAGLFEYQAEMAVPVPGGIVNAAGGNLSHRFVAFSVDTMLGTHDVSASYNSATGLWLWSFDISYDGVTFVDETGAAHPVAHLAQGAAIPGTHWVKLDATRLQTKGGLVYKFRALDGRLATIGWSDPLHPFVAFLVDTVSGSVRTVGVVQCRFGTICSALYQVFYDAQGCVDRVVDHAGREASFANDASCKLETARDGLDVDRGWPGHRYEYTGGLLSALINSEGERVEYEYLSGRLVRAAAIGEGDLETHFAYGFSPATELYYTGVAGPRGDSRILRYDFAGRLWSTSDDEGGGTTLSWSGLRPTSRTDTAGVTTMWQWADDDPVSITLPSGNQLTISYAPGARNPGAPTRRAIDLVTDSLGVVVDNEYDAAGLLVGRVNGAGEAETFEYDPEGSLSRTVTAAGHVTEYFSYTDRGHPWRVVSGGIEDRRSYDAVGNLIEGSEIATPLSPGRPGVRRRFFDADRNIVRLELEAANPAVPFGDTVVEFDIEYRSDHRPTRIARPGGGDTEYLYDALGRITERRERVDGAWSSTHFSHDSAGDLRAIELANGMRREIDYDKHARPVSVRLLEAGVLEDTLTLAYESGRLVSRSDTSWGGTESFVYDGAGRLSKIVFPDGEMLEVDYDLRSRRVARRYWSQPYSGLIRALGFEWDGADRQVAIVDDGEIVLERDYLNGRQSEIRYGNGLVRSFDWDATSGLPLGSSTYEDDGDRLEATTLDWSMQGQLMAINTETIIDATDENATASITWESYGIDHLPEPATASDIAGPRLLHWYGFRRHDALGNWWGTGNGTTFGSELRYNAEGNRLLSADLDEPHVQASRSYGYDAAGFLTDRDGQSLDWDAGGRISALDNGDTFEWDVLGRLVSSQIGGVVSRGRFGGEVRGDALGNPASIDLNEVRIDLTTNDHLYRHLDFRRNVKFVSSDSGEVVLHYQYAGYGVEAVFGSGTDTTNFAGGTAVGGFVLLGARVYDPETARFISPDPVHQVVNQYAYTLGNPIFLWDPDGLQAEPVGGKTAGQRAWDGFRELPLPVGVAFFATGLGTANPMFVAVGSGFMLLHATIVAFESGGTDCGCTVTIQDVPADAGDTDGFEGAQQSAPGCSPTSLGGGSDTNLPIGGFATLQGLTAVLLIVMRRRRRRSPEF